MLVVRKTFFIIKYSFIKRIFIHSYLLLNYTTKRFNSFVIIVDGIVSKNNKVKYKRIPIYSESKIVVVVSNNHEK